MFNLVYSDSSGSVYDEPEMEALAFTGSFYREFFEDEMIFFPHGTVISLMPGHLPLGKYKGKVRPLRKLPGIKESLSAVSALLPNGYTRLLLPAYTKRSKSVFLPLFAYTAMAFRGENFCVAAHETDMCEKWNPCNYSTPELSSIVEKRLAEEPDNRLLHHLSNCALNYQCYNGQNIFYRRWEGGIPLSSSCNARCLGCISFQKEEAGFPSPQDRIVFTPSIEEIMSIGLKHLNEAPDAILSFGQGCEGEPTIHGDLLVKSIKELRKRTSEGTIHLNTNGSSPQVLSRAFRAGLDSVRISLNSAIEEHYTAYFRPKFSFKDVKKSFNITKDFSIFVSVNLLVMPGFTDREEEIEALFGFLKNNPVDMIQLRNHNFDPDLYFRLMPPAKGKIIGMINFINLIKKTFPQIKIGSVNQCVR